MTGLVVLSLLLVTAGPLLPRPLRGYDHGVAMDLHLWRLPGKSLDNQDLYLTPAATSAWIDLVEYAARQGRFLQPTYAFRTHKQQVRIYRQNRRLAAPPGFSSHQRGVSLDINGMSKNGRRSSLFFWMAREAPAFGFTNDVKNEPWHWSFTEPAP